MRVQVRKKTPKVYLSQSKLPARSWSVELTAFLPDKKRPDHLQSLWALREITWKQSDFLSPALEEGVLQRRAQNMNLSGQGSSFSLFFNVFFVRFWIKHVVGNVVERLRLKHSIV